MVDPPLRRARAAAVPGALAANLAARRREFKADGD
jgi:hypothetical protein